MIIDIECPRCFGSGEVTGTTPTHRSRMVGYDDLDPGDYAKPCPKCAGTGTVEHDLNEDCE